MVPEWSKKLDMKVMKKLQESAKNHRYQDVSQALDNLTKNCDSCHTDYRAITATMYRAADFSSMEISPSISFNEHMQELTQQVNQIKIASEDGMTDVALSSLATLTKGIKVLGKTCANCHKKDTRQYPDETIRKTMTHLAKSLKTGSLKDQGRDLGTLAVLACARCHGTHRIAYDTRKMFVEGPNWLELIRH